MAVICSHHFSRPLRHCLSQIRHLVLCEWNHIEGLMMAWYSLLTEIDSCIKRVKDFKDELQTRNINKLKSYSIFCIDHNSIFHLV